MAYLYADWASQATNQARYNRLALFIGELSALVGQERSSGGHSVGSQGVAFLLTALYKERARLEGMPGVSSNGTAATSPMTVAKLVSRRDIR